MNLEESNSYNEEIQSRERKRKGVMLSIVLCGLFIALLFIMIIILKYQDSITEKFFINGKQTTKLTNSIYTEINGVTYIDVKAFSSVLGYTYTKGEYKKYNENEDSCYLQNDFEIVALTSGDTNYDKYIELSNNAKTLADIQVTTKSENGYSENYKLENPIVFEGGKIYVPLDSISKMFNINISWEQYRKNIFTLENRIMTAQKKIPKYKLAEMSGYYENLRAIIDGFVIVGDAELAADGTSSGKSKYYGVILLKDGSEVISKKYDEITYIQNVEEFYITVENGTMGLLDTEGGTIIPPSEFEKISLLDEKNELYLVQKGQEYGVVGRKGEVLIHSDFDAIGLDEKWVSEFNLEPIENRYLLYDNCIPVEKNEKVGLFNKKGDEIQQANWQGFGYKSTATSKTSGNEQSVLLIPPTVGIKGIVVNYNDLYGIFDATEERLLFPCVYSKIYAITKNGTTTYYAEFNGDTIDIQKYIEENGLKNVDENGELLKKNNNDNNNNNNNVNDSEVPVDNGNTSSDDNSVIVIE